MSTETQRFHHVLVGTGQATGTLVSGLPEDESIAVIEGGAIGGTCVNVGCTPTKTLVASARVAQLARRAGEYGVGVGSIEVDFTAAMARMNEIRHGSRDGLESFLGARENVILVRGRGRFVGPRTLRVGDRLLTAERVYLNVGARAVTPPIDGLVTVPWLDDARILDLEALPSHLVVIGGSYVALELGQVFRRFGARVTVIEAADRFLAREDEDVAGELRAILEGEGLEAARVATDERGYVVVDDVTRTSAEGVFALGDVNGRGAFTHTSVHDAQVLLDHLRGAPNPRTIGERPVVYALFTDPPLGRVGMTEAQAGASGRRVLRGTKPMRTISRAEEMGETQGFVKVLVDAESDRLLGASVLGVGGDEVVNLFALAMAAGMTTETFRRAVLVHPTVGELMPWVLDGLRPIAGR